jgi:hypothetical protein
MVYLPPSSWWRFVGWLVLGSAAYTGYGYCHSTIGRGFGRPAKTPWALRLAAAGFLVMAAGLFVVPHGAGIGELLSGLPEGPPGERGRALGGALLVALGLATGVLGWVATARAARQAAGTGPGSPR